MAPKKKEDGLLGPDGRAISQAFGGLGRQVRRYTDWRSAHNAKVRANASKNKPTKTETTKTEAQKRAEARKKTSYTVSGVEYWRDTGKAKKRPGGFSSPNGYSIDPKTGKRTNNQKPNPTPKNPPTKNPPTKNPPTKNPPTKVTPTKNPPTSDKKEPAKKKTRTWLADNYKPGKGPARRSTPGITNNKLKQSKRMADALKNLKVRKY